MFNRHEAKKKRQGYDNNDVDISRYVTDKSFEAYRCRIFENKQMFIVQVMSSKTSERVCSLSSLPLL